MLAIRKKLGKYKDLWVRVRNAPSFNIGGGNHEIDFVIRGPELLSLARYAEDLRKRSIDLGGIVDADITLKLNNPELRVEIDRARAADLSVSTRDVAQALRVMVGGEEEVTRFRDPP
jgi:HAE1 family hydrophobic/amphiphilic exporter-1